MAKDDLPGSAESLENMTAAMDAVSKAAEVSTLMLTYLGQTVVKREPLDLSETCRRSLPILRAGIRESAVWETNLPSPGPAISSSANQIQQVITNLITNASESLKDSSGNIRLAVRTVFSADISAINRFPVDWQPKNSAYACVEVEDSGCGIPDNDIEKIFDPFFSTKFVKPVKDMIETINEQTRGWKNYFSTGYPGRAFRDLNHFIRNRVIGHLQRRSQRGHKIPKGCSYYSHLMNLGLKPLLTFRALVFFVNFFNFVSHPTWTPIQM